MTEIQISLREYIARHPEGVTPSQIRERLYRLDPYAIDEALISMLREGLILAADRGRLFVREHALGAYRKCRGCRGSGQDRTGAITRRCMYCDGKGVI